jgi:hypothetical protein
MGSLARLWLQDVPLIVKLVNVEVRATKCIKQEWSRTEARSKQPVTYIE